jgi:hypothetical protein
MRATRDENLAKGIPVDARVWKEILRSSPGPAQGDEGLKRDDASGFRSDLTIPKSGHGAEALAPGQGGRLVSLHGAYDSRSGSRPS